MNEINRLLSIMSTFKPVKGKITNIKIVDETPYYNIDIELDSAIYISLPIPINMFSFKDDEIRQYVHDKLNKEITNYLEGKNE